IAVELERVDGLEGRDTRPALSCGGLCIGELWARVSQGSLPAPERRTADTEEFRRPRTIALCPAQRGLDPARESAGITGDMQSSVREDLRAVLRETVEIDLVLLLELEQVDGETLGDVLQFAYVSRPGVSQQMGCQRIERNVRAQRGAELSQAPGHQDSHERHDVALALAKRRDRKSQGV